MYSAVQCWREHPNLPLSLCWCSYCKCQLTLCQCTGRFRRCQPHKQFAEALGEGNICVCSTLMCPFNRKSQCTCVAMRSAGLQILVLCTWLCKEQVASRAVMCFQNTTMQRHQSLVLGKCCKHFLTTQWRLFIYKKRQSSNVTKKLSCQYAFCHSGLRLSAPGKRSVQSLPLSFFFWQICYRV